MCQANHQLLHWQHAFLAIKHSCSALAVSPYMGRLAGAFPCLVFALASCQLPLFNFFPMGSELRQCSIMPHCGHFDGDSSQVLAYFFLMSCCAISLHALSASTFGNPQKYVTEICPSRGVGHFKAPC